jgi:hypothetical protein
MDQKNGNCLKASKHLARTGQVQDKLHTDNPDIAKLVRVIGEQELSVKEMMNGVGLKGRDNFLSLYLNPAIAEGYVRLLYPDKPRHPRQRYLLTVKGLALYKTVISQGRVRLYSENKCHTYCIIYQ